MPEDKKYIEPLESFFGTPPWPPNDEFRRIKQLGATVGAYGVLIMVSDWETRPRNKVNRQESIALYNEALWALDFLGGLGRDPNGDDVAFLAAKLQLRRIYYAATNSDVKNPVSV